MWGNPCFDFACSCARGLSGGILSVWDPNVFVKGSVHCMDNVVIFGGVWVPFSFPCYMVNIYAPQGIQEKFDLWQYLMDFKRRNGGNYMCFGDFNVVREVYDRMGLIFCSSSASDFNDFIDDMGLIDVPMIRKRFTRIDASGSKLSKLDRFLVDEVFYDRFENLQISILDRRWSDHCPIFLHVSLVDYGPFSFKFFNSWLDLDGFNDMVKDAIKELVVERSWTTRNLLLKSDLHQGIPGSEFVAFTVMSTGDFLNLHPSELKFQFELKKQSSCSLQLTNKTDQYIAFKVKTTNPKKYCVRPNTGIVLPRSVCNVTVTMQAQKETPSDMQCKDKFLLQAVIAPIGATNKDITANMFNKEENKVVEEFKLRVVYIPANPPSPVPEESEEGSSPRGEDGSQNSSWPDVTTRSVDPKEKLSAELVSMVSRLTDEKTAALKQSQKLQQELELMRKQTVKNQSGGYSILFLVVVGIISVVVGYLIKQT
ncbi:unnamed protein product [Lactuca saligna]|uniref:MSP domain-containing protein n=1 Tax=Lactuca saligna TaxID=75948 RepID=A0AA35ZGS2_LACSI|nr:unnamed protein product [Lactuca saligna]